jgi:CheY-like chemotaxis protein
MDSVLIVNPNPVELRDINNYLKQLAQFKVMTASNEKAVRHSLQQEDVSVLVLDIDMPDIDPLNLLAHMTHRHADVPCIVTSDRIPVFSDPRDGDTVLRYLKKPYDFSSLAMDIFEALTLKDEGLSFYGISVRCFLPLFEISKKTGSLKIHSRGNKPGILHFRDGKLIGADYGPKNGEAAILEILELRRTEMTVTALIEDKTENHIDKRLIDLIGARWSDKISADDSPGKNTKESLRDDQNQNDLTDIPAKTSTATRFNVKGYRLDSVCKKLLGKIDDARGMAIIDLNNGEILAFVQTASCFAEGHVATAAATLDFFKSNAVKKLLSLEQGDEQKKSIIQLQMTTERTYHFMSVLPERENILLVLTTGKQGNLGIGWVAMREALSKVAALYPVSK